jgi:hypothetical protein
MRNNNQQWKETTTATPFNAELTPDQPSVHATQPAAEKIMGSIMNSNDKLARRYSIDDNGGGYQGL